MRKRIALIILTALLVFGGLGIYYLGPQIFADIAYPLRYPEIVQKYAKQFGVDACLVQAVIEIESRGNPRAVSRAGARGLMQLMPGTFRSVINKFDLPNGDAFDPETNIRTGTRLIRYNLDAYGTLRNLAVAYNAGGARVKLADAQLPRETKNYIKKLNTAYSAYKSSHPGHCTASSTTPLANSFTPPEPDLPDFEAPAPVEQPNYLKPEDFWKALFTN